MKTCTACADRSDHLRPALVFMGPGDLRPGEVCDECAALGCLLVMGPDAGDVLLPANAKVDRREPRSARSSSKGKGKGRQRAGREPEGEPLPLPQSSRETLLWRTGFASELARSRGQSAAAVTHQHALTPAPTKHMPAAKVAQEGWDPVEEEQYQKWKARLIAELADEAPTLLKVLAIESEIEVSVETRTVQCDGTSLRGRVARLIAEGFFADPRRHGAVIKEMKRTGTEPNGGSLSRELDHLVSLRLLTRESDGYRTAPGAHVRLREAG